MKKAIASLLMIVLVVAVFCVPAFAAGTEVAEPEGYEQSEAVQPRGLVYYKVNANTVLRSSANPSSSVVLNVSNGQVVYYSYSTTGTDGNTWYYVVIPTGQYATWGGYILPQFLTYYYYG